MAQDTLRLNISQCRHRALETSRDLQRSENALKQAELTRKSAFTNYFPQASGMATAMWLQDQQLIDGEMGSIDMVMRGAYMCGLSLMQPIYAGGKILNGNKLSKVGEEIAKDRQRLQESQVIADVESAYWTYVAVLGKERLIDRYCRNLDTLFAQVEGGVSAGMATDYDLLQVASARSNLAYQRQRVNGGVMLCRLSLSQMVGISGDEMVLLPDTVLPVASVPLLDNDFSTRPELSLLQHAVDASELQVKMKLGDCMPTLGVGLSYLWMGNIGLEGGLSLAALGTLIPGIPPIDMPIDKNIKIHTPVLAVSLTVPITKWWQGSYEMQKAKLEVQNSRLEQEKNTDLMRLEVQQAVNNVETGYALIASSTKALAAAEEQLRVARNRYNVKMIPLSELLDAQAKWQQAESDCIEARCQYMIYLAEYRRVTGQK